MKIVLHGISSIMIKQWNNLLSLKISQNKRKFSLIGRNVKNIDGMGKEFQQVKSVCDTVCFIDVLKRSKILEEA